MEPTTTEMIPATDEVSTEIVPEIMPEIAAPMAVEAPVAMTVRNPYQGMTKLEIPPEAAAMLAEPPTDEMLAVLPTGEVYVSQVHYRRLLNRAFGPGQWALMPRGDFKVHGKTVAREYALIVRECFVSETMGEAEYQPNNARMSYATACEACKSNALTRTCKDLGMFSECWDSKFAERFKHDRCVAVWRRDAKTKRPQWRLIDSEPFYDESGPVNPGTAAQAQAPNPAPSQQSESPRDTVPRQDDPVGYCDADENNISGAFAVRTISQKPIGQRGGQKYGIPLDVGAGEAVWVNWVSWLPSRDTAMEWLDIANAAKENRTLVNIVAHRGTYGFDIKAMSVTEDAPADLPASPKTVDDIPVDGDDDLPF